MVNYRRNRIQGGTFFFTVTLRDRRSHMLIEHVDRLRDAFKDVQRAMPFRVDAIVVLPDHLHTVWTLPEEDDDFAGCWKRLKSHFTRVLIRCGVVIDRDHRGEYNLWQRRYWEHPITDAQDLQRHVDYIHYNPVKHGLVSCPVDWPYSSFHRYVRLHLLERDWAAVPMQEENGQYGE